MVVSGRSRCYDSAQKIEWPQLKLVPNCRQHRPILRPDHVIKSNRVPEHNIRILDRPIGLGPSGKAVIPFALVRVHPPGIALLQIIRGNPEMIVGEASTPLRIILGTQQ